MLPRATAWLLVLLALAVRIGLGSFVLPSTVLEGAAAERLLSSTLCEGRDRDGGPPRPHAPTDAGEGVLLLGDVLAVPVLTAAGFVVSLLPTSRIIPELFQWHFPPVRGPPARISAALFAQGPPA